MDFDINRKAARLKIHQLTGAPLYLAKDPKIHADDEGRQTSLMPREFSKIHLLLAFK